MIIDHRSLQYINTQPTLSCQQAKWSQLLQTFTPNIIYKPGKTLVIPDILSRRPDLTAILQVTVVPEFLNQIKTAYKQDALVLQKDTKEFKKKYTFKDNLRYYQDKIYIRANLNYIIRFFINIMTPH